MELNIIYRISNNSYNKQRLEKATKFNCLKNCLNAFHPHNHKWIILADNLNNETYNEIFPLIHPYLSNLQFIPINTGSGAQSFNYALNLALNLSEDEYVYFIEDDYIWRDSLILKTQLQEAFELGCHYFSHYLHPDKFLSPNKGGNPEVDNDGGYLTKIYDGGSYYYAIFNSTTMTFLCNVKTLKEDENILRKHTQGTYPNDYQMFLELRDKGRVLLCPLETGCTHSEINWLAKPPISNNNIEYWNKMLL